MRALLVDPVLLGGLVGGELLGLEPQTNLVVGGLDGVRTVADVTSDMDGEVSPDGAGLRVGRVRLSQHDAASLDSVETFPDHSADRPAGHVRHQATEETLLGEVA